jgi:hypothetical protein
LLFGCSANDVPVRQRIRRHRCAPQILPCPWIA